MKFAEIELVTFAQKLHSKKFASVSICQLLQNLPDRFLFIEFF